MGQLVINTAYLLIGAAVFIVARILLQGEETLAAQERLAEGGERRSSNALVRITRPFFTRYVVPIIRSKRFWDDQRKVFRRKLISSGLSQELDPDEFIAFKLLLVPVFPLVGGILKGMELLDPGPLLMLALAVGGWFYPNLWVNSRIAKRQKQILKSLPFIVDLLALSTEAGLDFVGAIGKVVEKANPSPLVDEFAQMLREIRLGSGRQEALREMSGRIDMMEFNSFATILISADQMGASIGKILRQQSEQIRTERMLRAEKAGAAAASRVMIPVILFIVPAVFLMVAAPFALRFIYPEQ